MTRDWRSDRDLDSHVHEARAEDARFLLANGTHREEEAPRLGVSWDGVEKLLDREPEKKRGPQ